MIEGYKSLVRAEGQLQAEIIKAYIESQDIPCLLLQESIGITLGLTVGPFGEVDIQVPEEKYEEAELLLERMDEARDSDVVLEEFPEDSPDLDNPDQDQDTDSN